MVVAAGPPVARTRVTPRNRPRRQVVRDARRIVSIGRVDLRASRIAGSGRFRGSGDHAGITWFRGGSASSSSSRFHSRSRVGLLQVLARRVVHVEEVARHAETAIAAAALRGSRCNLVLRSGGGSRCEQPAEASACSQQLVERRVDGGPDRGQDAQLTTLAAPRAPATAIIQRASRCTAYPVNP